MKINFDRIETLLRYIIAIAGQNDPQERELGPIHLIKYVYIADLEYAKKRGMPFTGIRWKFYHFGPWAAEVYNRIEQVMTQSGAKKKIITNPKIKDDIVRYYLEDDQLIEEIEKELPWEIVIGLKKAIKNFSNDTTSLLHYVYLTPPMLKAAPGEYLEFSLLKEPNISEKKEIEMDDSEKISKEELKSIRAEVRRRLNAKKESQDYVIPDPSPRYDEIFFKGLEELERIDLESDFEREYLAEFSDKVWKSKARYDPNLS